MKFSGYVWKGKRKKWFKNAFISETERDRAISTKFLTHRVSVESTGDFLTLENVETSDRFEYSKQSFACTNFQNGNSRIYQEVYSTGGVGHLNRPNRCLFSCSNSPSISKISEISAQNGVFQFWALLFGVATAPLEFTQIVKEVKLLAQARNLRIHQYLDDWLLPSPTKEQCLIDSQNLVKLVQELGQLINFQKSELVPM